ncbi:MAG: histidine kinase [Bacteroidota bacterium]
MRFLNALFIIVILLAVGPLQAEREVDSLWTKVAELPPGPELRVALVDLAIYHQMRNSDSVHYYTEQLLILGSVHGDDRATVHARLIQGSFHHNQGRLQKGREYYHRAISAANSAGIPSMLGYAYLDIGLAHNRGTDLDSAYYYLQLAERNFLEYGEEDSLWKVYGALGNLQDKRQDYEAADAHYRKAISIMPPTTPKAERGFLLYNTFAYSILRKRFDLMHEARIRWDEYKGANSFDLQILKQPEHFSLYRMMANQDVDIEEVLFAAAEYHEKVKSPFKLASVYHDLGIYYSDLGDMVKSRAAYEEADRLYSQVGYNTYSIYIRTQLAEFYAQDQNYQKAYEFTLASQQLLDSIRNDEAERNLKLYQVQFETAKKEQALRINQLELRQKTQERNIWLGSSVFLALLAVSIFSGARMRIRQREILAAQEAAIQEEKIQRLEQEKRVLALSSMIEGQEQERRRIAKDLHDGMGGLLTTIKAHYNTIADEIADGNKYQDVVPLTGTLIDRACTEVRRISQNMMPAALLYSGLEGAIEDLAVQVRTSGLECNLEVVGDLNKLEEAKAVSIYRILQEAVNNILKHAAARRVLLQLIIHQETLHITIEDNGKGFVFEEGLQQKSVGMKSLGSRVQYLQGSWDVDSEIGEGTTITFNIPVQ